MIDKEKLLRVAKSEYGTNGVVYKFISNFPEEPEIDFDALFDEFNKVCTLNCSKCQFIKHNNVVVCYNEFLKSKNLTAPQIDIDKLRHDVYSEIVKTKLDIPVKKTWTLKKEVEETFKDFNMFPLKNSLEIEPEDKLKKYYDLHEEPDYREIPKGSIVECVTKTAGTIYDKIGRVTETQVWFNHYSNIAMSNIVSIRIVELAKE